jgi:hypothetical protein
MPPPLIRSYNLCLSQYTLEKMAGHIAFEFARFEFSTKPEIFHQPGEHGGLVREAFLVHYRNLIDFFYEKKGWPSDARAADYIEGSIAWKANRPPWVAAERERCHKLLAHLTYDRVAYAASGSMTWDLEDKIDHLRAEWRAFLAALPPARRGWFA